MNSCDPSEKSTVMGSYSIPNFPSFCHLWTALCLFKQSWKQLQKKKMKSMKKGLHCHKSSNSRPTEIQRWVICFQWIWYVFMLLGSRFIALWYNILKIDIPFSILRCVKYMPRQGLVSIFSVVFLSWCLALSGRNARDLISVGFSQDFKIPECYHMEQG